MLVRNIQQGGVWLTGPKRQGKNSGCSGNSENALACALTRRQWPSENRRSLISTAKRWCLHRCRHCRTTQYGARCTAKASPARNGVPRRRAEELPAAGAAGQASEMRSLTSAVRSAGARDTRPKGRNRLRTWQGSRSRSDVSRLIEVGLADPVTDVPVRALELPGELSDRSPRADQLHHLVAKLGR